ncbi:MAG: hypothetical protein J1F03_08435 [Oscillospiraceae bacterium]|nr:hypothetical protein [Oscillospiraceae bacterium]
MDNICEQIVVKSRTNSDKAKAALIIVGMAVIAAALLYLSLIINFYVLLLAVGAVAGGIYLLNGLSVEYEYIITNNELDIDKIIGRRKRKRMITVDLSRAEDFCRYPMQEEPETDTTVYASTGLEKDACYLFVSHKDYGKVGVIFNPNKITREAIVREFPNALRARLDDNVK